jgi:RNA polymerase-binding transcription factor DksA
MQLGSGMQALSVQDAARHKLLARRSQLLHRFHYASELADELAADRNTEVVDRANDHWDAHVLSKLGDAETRQLSQVMAALRRLADGSYGTCLNCQKPIERGRLDAVPEAAHCASCARYLQPR